MKKVSSWLSKITPKSMPKKVTWCVKSRSKKMRSCPKNPRVFFGVYATGCRRLSSDFVSNVLTDVKLFNVFPFELFETVLHRSVQRVQRGWT